jgi:hypothetical protein
MPASPPVIPMDVGQIIERAFGLFRRHWLLIAPFVAVVLFPSSLLQYWLFREGNRRLLRFTSPVTHETHIECIGPCAPVIFRFVLAITIGVLASVPISIVLSRAAARAFSGAGPPDLAVGESLARVPAALVAAILAWLAILAGFVLLVIPGFIVLVRFSVARQVVAIERAGPVQALRRSWRLTRGNGWHTLGIVIVIGFLAAVAGQAVQIVRHAPAGVQVIFAAAIATVVRPFVSFARFLLYVDVRARTDGLTSGIIAADLERRT